MRHWRASAVITILILIICMFNLPSLYAESGLENNYWWRSFYTSGTLSSPQMLSLEHEELKLPTEDIQGFSQEAQDELYNVVSKFGEENIDKETFYKQVDGAAADISGEDFVLNLDREELEESQYTLTSRLTLTADEEKIVPDDSSVEEVPNFSVNYNLSDSTTFRAGLGKNSLPVLEKDDTDDNAENHFEETDEDMLVAVTDTDLINEERLETKDGHGSDWEESTTETGRIGISYSPADSLALTADYSQGDFFAARNSALAVFGLEYDDRLGSIKASYQIEEGEMLQQTTTGLQMEVMDFAQLSASYSLLDFEELESKLKQQTSVDLGLDFNVTDFSTFSLGYNWQEATSDLNEVGDESNIRASFTIDF